MASDRITRVAKRSLQKRGVKLTLVDFESNDDRDPQGDVTYSETTRTVTGIMTQPTEPKTTRTAGGSEVAVEAVVYLESDEDVTGVDDAPGDGAVKATEVRRADGTGRDYRVITSFNESNGLQRIDAAGV